MDKFAYNEDDLEVLDKEELVKRLRWYEHKYGIYISRRGLRNWRNLFRKPTLYEWTILFMLIMALFIAWAYNYDTALCREYLNRDYDYWLKFTNGTGIINYYGELSEQIGISISKLSLNIPLYTSNG